MNQDSGEPGTRKSDIKLSVGLLKALIPEVLHVYLYHPCSMDEPRSANIKESPARLEAGKKAFEAAGIKQKAFYMVMGRYDMVTIAEAPEPEPVESKQTTWS